MRDGTAEESPKPTAAGRLLALLGSFAGSDGALRLTEISKRSGLTLTTTHRLVRELLEWGGLEMDHAGRYRLGVKFLQLTSASTEGLHLREAVLPYLIDLHRRTGLTVHLAVRHGRNVMNLDSLRLHPNYGGANRIGGSVPLHVGASGLVLLANAEEEVIRSYLQEPLQRVTPATIDDAQALRRALHEVRRLGYSVARDTPVEGRGMVAAPVRRADGRAEAAIGLICWLDRHDPDDYIGLVCAAAQKASRSLAART